MSFTNLYSALAHPLPTLHARELETRPPLSAHKTRDYLQKSGNLGDTGISKIRPPRALRGKLAPSKHATTFPCTQTDCGNRGLGKEGVAAFLRLSII
jgi:hypothetical protein